MILVVGVCVCVCVCSVVSAPGGNRKQGSVAGVYVQRSSVFLPRRLAHSSEGLFSLLRHADDTANQGVSCFKSLRKKIQKNVFSLTCCIIKLGAVTFI